MLSQLLQDMRYMKGKIGRCRQEDENSINQKAIT